MGMDIQNNVSMQSSSNSYYSLDKSVQQGTSETSGVNVNQIAEPTSVQDVRANAAQPKTASYYEETQGKMALEQEVDKLIKQIMPDLGVKFKIHDSGQIITSVVNNDTKEVIREFPAEKMLDIIHNMCTKLGILGRKRL